MIFKVKHLKLDKTKLKKRRGTGEWYIENQPLILESITYLNLTYEFYPFKIGRAHV